MGPVQFSIRHYSLSNFFLILRNQQTASKTYRFAPPRFSFVTPSELEGMNSTLIVEIMI